MGGDLDAGETRVETGTGATHLFFFVGLDWSPRDEAGCREAMMGSAAGRGDDEDDGAGRVYTRGRSRPSTFSRQITQSPCGQAQHSQRGTGARGGVRRWSSRQGRSMGELAACVADG